MQIFHVANIWSHSSYIHILLHVYTAVLDLKVVTEFPDAKVTFGWFYCYCHLACCILSVQQSAKTAYFIIAISLYRDYWRTQTEIELKDL